DHPVNGWELRVASGGESRKAQARCGAPRRYQAPIDRRAGAFVLLRWARVRYSMDIRLVWLALGAFAGSVESSLIVAVLPALSSETGVSIGDAGWLVTAYALAYGLG